MKAIIITDAEARSLLASLELTKLRHKEGRLTHVETDAFENAHRAFHYVVTRWLQDMGAECVGGGR